MRRLLALAIVVPLVVVGPPASAGGQRCHGRAVTLVGEQYGSVEGTAGSDVVATNGADRVHTFGGDDVVCVTGPAATVQIDVARGNDLVDTTRASSWVGTRLGAGADRLIGGSQTDDVGDYRYDVYDDGSRDVIRTGGGEDRVATSDGGRADRDVIVLGAGDDWLTFVGGHVRTRVDGGEGDDGLAFEADYTTSARIVVDNRRRRSMTEGRRTLRWAGFERFDLSYTQARRAIFLGSANDERVSVVAADMEVDLRTGGGDDLVELSHRVTGRADLGAGTDELGMYGGEGPLVVDLPRRSARFLGDGGRRRFIRVLGVEDVSAVGWLRATVVGGAGPNWFRVRAGCQAVLRGGPGDDRFARRAKPRCDEGRHPTTTMRGGAGDDAMLGSKRSDVLIGGPGDDRADGRTGIDTCEAETRRHCELP